MADDIRPSGSVAVCCEKCEWTFWIDCLDPRLPTGPFVCMSCRDPDARFVLAPDGKHLIKES